MPALPVSIGLSINEKKCYYLSWIPSESGPLVINYGIIKNYGKQFPFNNLFDQVKQNNYHPQFSISLSNDFVKYDFFKSSNNYNVDNWNWDNFYDHFFLNLYDSYLYEGNQGVFNIHILKKVKNNIIDQVKKEKFALMNLGVGIFSALEGLKAWTDISMLDEYIIMKFSKRKVVELLLIQKDNFSGYLILRKTPSSTKILDYFGDNKYKKRLHKIVEAIFDENFTTLDSKIFYYSIDGNKADIDLLLNCKSRKLELINPFKNLAFDDNCVRNIKDVNASSYAEIGNVFRGVDV